MTKEELEKEAVRYCTSNCGDCYGCHKKYRKNKNCERLKSMIKTYLTSAEPREKQIEIDAKQIRALQKQNGELTDRLETGIALKDEEISCILTDFNTFKSKAEEIIKELLNSCFGYNSKTVNYEVKAKAEQFLKENA